MCRIICSLPRDAVAHDRRIHTRVQQSTRWGPHKPGGLSSSPQALCELADAPPSGTSPADASWGHAARAGSPVTRRQDPVGLPCSQAEQPLPKSAPWRARRAARTALHNKVFCLQLGFMT